MKITFLSGAINFLGEQNDRRFWIVEPATAAQVRSSAPDPFSGARGHDYIRLRGLAPKIGPLARTDEENCQCGACVRNRMLPAVLAICNRRKHEVQPGDTTWNDMNNDQVYELLDVHAATGA